LEDTFIIQDIDINVTLSKKRELERATTAWVEVIGKEVLNSQ